MNFEGLIVDLKQLIYYLVIKQNSEKEMLLCETKEKNELFNIQPPMYLGDNLAHLQWIFSEYDKKNSKISTYIGYGHQ